MVRNYKKKREREVNEQDINNAVLEVVNGNMKLRKAAEVYNVKPNTLHYRIRRYKENRQPNNEEFTSKYTVAQVFNKNEEKMLEEYLLKSSKMNYGLTYKQARTLAFEYATALQKCPTKWTENREAGIEWLKGFMKRHKELSLRKPENTSLSRSTSFNKHNVTEFYNNYEKALKKNTFAPDRMYNLDETNIMTVVQAPNVIAKTGVKQVGQCVSAERGQLITMCAIVNAIGNSLPPVFIFPRARFHDSMLFGAPTGSVGYCNSPTSGWMTGCLFIKVLEHLKRLTRCSKEDQILLLMDNHESHCTLDAINYCRENGMVVITFPPHCTHRMQPLDVAVNGPFKQKLSIAQNDWLLSHPAKAITIHDLASIVTPAYNASHTARNIISGFSAPGIYPFSRNAFSDDDFEGAEVTNRPLPETQTLTPSGVLDTLGLEVPTNEATREFPTDRTAPQVSDAFEVPASSAVTVIRQVPDVLEVPATREVSCVHESSAASAVSAIMSQGNVTNIQDLVEEQVAKKNILSPEVVRPFPKAPPRKNSRRGRRKGKSRILTDTPEKQEVEKAYLERMKRLEKKSSKKTRAKYNGSRIKNKRPKRKTYFTDSDTDTELNSEEDVSEMVDYDTETELGLNSQNIKPGDFVLALIPSERNTISLAFVGRVDEEHGNAFTVNFLKKKGFNKFFFPEKEDKSYVSIMDILAKLPSPQDAGGTSRTASMFTFKFNFNNFKLG